MTASLDSRPGEGMVLGCPSLRRHGTYVAYEQDRCRCPAARTAEYHYRKRLRVARASGAVHLVDALGTQRRLRALQVLGWDQPTLADRLGISRERLLHIHRQQRVRRSTALRVVRLYAALASTPGPSPAAAAAARRAGHAPPSGWTDIDLDAQPWQGAAAVTEAGRECAYRRCARPVPRRTRRRYCSDRCSTANRREYWRDRERTRRATARRAATVAPAAA